MMAVITLSSCSEDDDTTDEYANWQERNDKAFADTLAYAKAQIAAGRRRKSTRLNSSHSGESRMPSSA